MKIYTWLYSLANRSILAQLIIVGLVAAISLSISVALFQLSLEFRNHSNAISKDINRTLQSSLTSAERAIFNYDYSLAERIAKDLLNNEMVSAAWLIDEHGNIIAEQHEENITSYNMPYLISFIGEALQLHSVKLLLNQNSNNSFFDAPEAAGTLRIEYKTHLSYRSLLKSTFERLALNISVVVLLTFLLIFLFNRLLMKPVKNLSRQLQNIDINDSEGKRLGEIYSHREDELGILNNSINSYLALADDLISRNKSALTDSKHSVESLQILVENLPHLISVVSLDGIVLLANQKFLKSFNVSEADIIGKTHQSIMSHYSEATRKFIGEADDEAIESKKSVLIPEVNWLRDDGTFLSLEIRKIVICYKNEDAILTVGVELSERKENQAYIQHLAYHDSLTGLPNRHLFLDRLEQALLRASRSKNIGALLFIDLDNFKAVNDATGHEIGDLLLVEAAKRLTLGVRLEDTVARLGGDEFVICMTDLGINDDEARPIALERANLLLNEMNRPYKLSGSTITSSASLGLAFFQDNAITASEILRHADLAMYRAKESGKNQLVLFEKEMDEANIRLLQLKKDCVIALRSKQLHLVYQPQIDSNSNKIIGCEALLRWNHPSTGFISPAEFIPLLEDAEMMPIVGEFVLNEAIKQTGTWLEDQLIDTSFKMSINVSPQQFRQSNFTKIVTTAIHEVQLPAHMVNLEITESMIIDNIDHTVASMKELRSIGIHFSIDDFGTGYSNLNYLKKLPLDELKVDQSFVRDILTDPNDTAIVRTIFAMADQLNLNTIAEGVETIEQLTLLREMGCTVYQGYLFSRPLDPVNFEKLFQQPSVKVPKVI